MPNVHREPRGSPENWSAWRDFEASLQEWAGHVLIAFSTNPDGPKGSAYNVTIAPNEFGKMAQMMVRANPTAAIRAFGTAMQEIPEILTKVDTAAAA
jgi:hypothetical protein